MPLLTFCGINNEGKTIIFGFACIKDESAIWKEWVMKKFVSFVKAEPLAVISDACPALRKAMKAEFPSAKLYLCAWHIQLN